MTPGRAVEAFARRHRYHPLEALPWLASIASYFVFPEYLALGAQILATILFALSADLVLGYAGIVTLGHAAFFGTGAYIAGILAAHGGGEPITDQDQTDYLKAAQCMRAHGVPEFPDPVFANGGVHFTAPAGLDTHSPQVLRAEATCRRLIPQGLPYSN